MDNQQTQTLHPKTDYTTDNPKSQANNDESSTGGLGGIGDKLSSAASGGSENSQSFLDKGISYLQQSITGKRGQTEEKGAQEDTSHHAAVDAADDEKISEFLRHQNKSMSDEEQGK